MGKLFTKILNNRLTLWAESSNKLDEGQGAYRKGRSTIDNMFTLYGFVEKYLCKKKGRFYCTFVDFSRAFDSVPHIGLWYRMIKDGIHGNFLCILRSMYSNLKSCVKTVDGLTEYFDCSVGTRQGCMISPTIFILYLNELVHILDDQCKGIYLDEIHHNVNVLMYADDIVLITDTIGRLQQQLNGLEIFCSKYGLNVNLSKTKLIVFRNGGILRKNEHVVYGSQSVEPVNMYKYLGLVFSSTLKWNAALSSLSEQASRAMFRVLGFNRNFGCLPVDISLQLFDKMVLPILLYGAELWGFEERETIEKVHLKFCKYILGVSSKTPNCAVLGELGRRPLFVYYMYKCVKFWLTLVQNYDPAKYTKKIYKVLYNYNNSGKITWATKVKLLLCSTGFGHVWINQGVGNIELFLSDFKQRLYDMSLQGWNENTSNMSKLSVYCNFKQELKFEPYLLCLNITKFRKCLTRFRCSSHKLAIERLRGTTVRENRICTYCKQNSICVVEDEYHFLLVCPLYQHIRQIYMPNVINNLNTFTNLLSSSNVDILRNLSTFIYHAFDIHKAFNNL